MNKMKKETKLILVGLLILVLIDQIFKCIALNNTNLVLIEGVLKINIYNNTNGSYGVNNSSNIMYVLTNMIVVIVAFQFITSQNQFVNNKIKVFLSLIMAGGISNCIDRIFRGYIVEFIDFTGLINIPIFNFADIYILIGWVAMAAIFAVFTVKELRNRKNIKKEG